MSRFMKYLPLPARIKTKRRSATSCYPVQNTQTYRTYTNTQWQQVSASILEPSPAFKIYLSFLFAYLMSVNSRWATKDCRSMIQCVNKFMETNGNTGKVTVVVVVTVRPCYTDHQRQQDLLCTTATPEPRRFQKCCCSD